jgi:arylsulfatase A-like enzyme
MKKILIPFLMALLVLSACKSTRKPNIVLVMTDDQGWGEIGYYDHPYLETPNLDAMAENGLRFDRFYAGSPVCSPTRASVLTGRSNDRTNVRDHGFPLRKQEKTIARALKEAGYITAHFGKWHLNGLRGRGAPVLVEDERHPGHFGFDEWLSATNYFDMDPILGRSDGKFEEFEGGSSTVIVNEALDFIRKEKHREQPFFIVIWYGSPHVPSKASEEDKKAFSSLDNSLQNHFGELVDVDNSIGDLRKGLRDMDMAENTLVWFISDNGGHELFGPDAVGGLRGFKKDLYEGGVRVPGIIEWPAVIRKPRVTAYPAVTMDIFPTIADIAGLAESSMTHPVDGVSLRKLFETNVETRDKPIPFRYLGGGALIDNNYKIVIPDIEKEEFELYYLAADPGEEHNLVNEKPEIARRMIEEFRTWNSSVEASIEGRDYPGGLAEPDPRPRGWARSPEYEPYIDRLKNRPEYRRYWEK